MPSFNRISFEDVIEANREDALEGLIVPKYRHMVGGQIFEYSNTEQKACPGAGSVLQGRQLT